MGGHIPLGASFCIAAAIAGEIDVNGTGIGTSMMTPLRLTERHMLMARQTEYSNFPFEGYGHPMAGMGGPCFSAVELMDGTVSGGGIYLYTEAGGDMVTMDRSGGEWDADGALAGIWAVSGGTGMWNEGTGEGTFV